MINALAEYIKCFPFYDGFFPTGKQLSLGPVVITLDEPSFTLIREDKRTEPEKLPLMVYSPKKPYITYKDT